MPKELPKENWPRHYNRGPRYDVCFMHASGRILMDPVLKYTPNKEVPVLRFAILSIDHWGHHERTNVEVWGPYAEIVNMCACKGSWVYCMGRKYTRRYKNREGKAAYWTAIRVQSHQQFSGVMFLDGRKPRRDEMQAFLTPSKPYVPDDELGL